MKKNIKIANIQFILCVFVVLIHSSTIFINLPGLDTKTIFGYNYSTFIQLFIGDGITRIAVPLFFIISGYLFYKNFDGNYISYKKKLKSRFFSLVIPYLFWSFLIFAVFTLAQMIPFLAPYFTTRNNAGFNIYDIWNNVIVDSYNSPLWYVRYLIVFTVFSPQIYLLMKKAPWVVLIPFICVIFGVSCGVNIRIDSLFYYGIGILIALNFSHYNKIINYLNNKKIIFTIIFSCIWILLLILRTYHYCLQEPDMMLLGHYDKYINVTGFGGIIFGIPAFWLLFDYFSNSKSIWKISQYSMLVYVTHAPIVNALKKLLMKFGVCCDIWSLIVFIITPFLTLFLIIYICYILQKLLPKFYIIISGNRN